MKIQKTLKIDTVKYPNATQNPRCFFVDKKAYGIPLGFTLDRGSDGRWHLWDGEIRADLNFVNGDLYACVFGRCEEVVSADAFKVLYASAGTYTLEELSFVLGGFKKGYIQAWAYAQGLGDTYFTWDDVEQREREGSADQNIGLFTIEEFFEYSVSNGLKIAGGELVG